MHLMPYRVRSMLMILWFLVNEFIEESNCRFYLGVSLAFVISSSLCDNVFEKSTCLLLNIKIMSRSVPTVELDTENLYIT